MIDQLTKDDIKDMFTSAVYRRGISYYQEGRVGELYHDPIRNIWRAAVRGSKSYQVTIEEDDTGISSECNCPAYNQYWEPCKHIAAVMLEIQDSIKGEFEKPSPQHFNIQNFLDREQKQGEERQAIYVKHLTTQFIQTLSDYSKGALEQAVEMNRDPLMVEWIIKLYRPSYSSKQFLALEMKAGQKRTYVVKKIRDFLKAIDRQVQYPFTKGFTFDPTEHEFTQEDQEIIKILQEAVKYEKISQELIHSYYQRSGFTDDRIITIPPMLADDLLTKLENRSVCFQNDGNVFNKVQVEHNEFPFSIQLDKGLKDGFLLDLTELLSFQYLELYEYIIQNNTFYKISAEQKIVITEMEKIMTLSKSHVLPIENDQIESFISQVVPRLGKTGKLEIAENVSSKIVTFPLHAKVYVDRKDELFQVTVEFHYGDHVINLFEQVTVEMNDQIIMRDAEKEQLIMDIIESASLRFNGKFLYVEGEEEIFEFLHVTLPLLEDKADIFLESTIKSWVLPDKVTPVTSVDVNSSGNWLDVSFNMDGIDQADIQNILRSVVEKKKYYRLPDGAFLSLESEEFQNIQRMFEELNIKPAQLQKESIQLPIYRGMQLDEIVDKEKGSDIKYGKQFRRLLNRLKNPEELEFNIPDALQAELRDYQNYGFQWLKTLSYYQLGGILADDMGLGSAKRSYISVA
ncbi:SNF2 helicase associated domain-containing protein [Bacillus cytotoxicus]|uniref:SNF2 helicase associated domain-containing protein n=1 Tax=Bacillus cytotoxicus TaxID=580165 RepID=A0ACC6A9C3_9BACI|nr:SNF2 helicase associated domain-containing protein [Bacillus cytotoxicus]